MQIGGGVRVGDAFQAIVGVNLIAIWGLWLRVEISQVGHPRLARFEQEKYETGQPRSAAKAEYVSG